MPTVKSLRVILTCGSMLAGVSWASAAAAQQSTPPLPAAPNGSASDSAAVPQQGTQRPAPAGTVNGDIIVTAQRRQERLRDVPVAVSVLGGQTIEQGPYHDVSEAVNRLPGIVATNDPRTGAALFQIRGVSTNSGPNTVGFYLDEAPFQFVGGAIYPDLDVYDLSRIEVLRGPQGTLYGVNSVSGVVRVETNDPDLNDLEAKGRFLISSIQGGGTDRRGDAALNVPLIDGKLAIRGVIGFQELGGWIDRPNQKDSNSGSVRDIRFKVRADPIENLSTVFSVSHVKNDYDGTAAGNSNNVRNSLIREPLTFSNDLYANKTTYDLGSFTASANTSYIKYDFDSTKRSQTSQNYLLTISGARSFSEEVVLRSSNSGRFRWDLGALYDDAKSFNEQNIGPASALPFNGFIVNTTSHSRSIAVYGEVGYKFFDKLELSGGLRYFHDHRYDLNNLAGTRPGDAKFNAVTPRVVLTYKPTPLMTAYLSYSQGFRSGALPPPFITGYSPASPDRLSNYEAGFKADLFNRTVSVDTAVFYYDWRKVQQQILVPFLGSFTSATVNGPSASGPGAEISVAVHPVSRLNLGGTFSYANITFDGDVISRGVVAIPKGVPLIGSVKYTYGGFIDYNVPVGHDLQLGISGSADYKSAPQRTIAQGAGFITVTDYSLLFVRGRVYFGPQNGRWTISLFGDNLTNDKVSAISPPGSLGDDQTRLQPRTFGAQVDFKF